MKYENTAILTDLDGTLFNSQGLVSDEDRAAIADYRSRRYFRRGDRPGAS